MEVLSLKISIEKLELAMARSGRKRASIQSVLSAGTLARIRRGCELRPYTVGRIAEALGVDPAELVASGEDEPCQK